MLFIGLMFTLFILGYKMKVSLLIFGPRLASSCRFLQVCFIFLLLY